MKPYLNLAWSIGVLPTQDMQGIAVVDLQGTDLALPGQWERQSYSGYEPW